MDYRRMLFVVLIAGSVLALVDQGKAADPTADEAVGFLMWENRDQDANAQPNCGLRIPDTHPYLALTPQDVERAQDRAGRWDWAKQAIEKCRSEADGHVNKPWDKLPDKGLDTGAQIRRNRWFAQRPPAKETETDLNRASPQSSVLPIRRRSTCDRHTV